MPNLTPKKVFNFILKIFLASFIIFWSGVNIYFNVLPYDEALENFENALNIESDNYTLESSTVFSTPYLNRIYEDAFQPLFSIAIITSFLAILLLSEGRTMREILILFLTFAIPRVKKHRGKVFDKKTNSPVPLATVRIYSSKDNRLIAQTVTDLDGRYNIQLPESNEYEYIIEVAANLYEPFRKTVQFDLTTLSSLEIVEDIDLDQTKTTPSGLKQRWLKVLPKVQTVFMYFLLILSFIATIHSVYGLLAHPQLDTVIYTILYGYGFTWNIFTIRERLGKNKGKVTDMNTKKPISGVIVSVYNNKKSIGTFATLADGTLSTHLAEGNYTALFNKSGYELKSNDSNNRFAEIKIGKNGTLLTNIRLTATGENKASLSSGQQSTIINPFS